MRSVKAGAYGWWRHLAGDNRPVWLVIGCMAVAIIALMIILALMFGLFLGRGQLGLALWRLASGGW